MLFPIFFYNDGYDVCHDPEEVILRKGYDPLADVRNTPDSVFCSHGAGYIVPYYEAYEHMHVLNGLSAGEDEALQTLSRPADRTGSEVSGPDRKIGTEEIDEILSHISRNKDKDKTPGTNWKRRFGTKEPVVPAGEPAPRVSIRIFSPEEAEYTVVDGYNVIFAWPELAELARINIDSARDALIDLLTHYRGMISGEVIAVFDAYRVKGRKSERTRYQNIQLVYTAEEETADHYIEKFTNEYGKKNRICVVTSDHLEQIITRGQGCMLISSRDFKLHLERLQDEIRSKYLSDN